MQVYSPEEFIATAAVWSKHCADLSAAKLKGKSFGYSHNGGVEITPFVVGSGIDILGRGELGHCLGTF